MTIDSALQLFKEKYDIDAIKSIIDLSNDRSLYKSSFTGFNIQESVNKFVSYLDGYSQYRIDNTDNTDTKSNDIIMEHTKLFIANQSKDNILFEESKIPFNDAANFVQEYVDSINVLVELVNSNQSIIMESTNDNDSSGCILKFSEMFLENLNNRVYPIMEHLLQSSGYYSRKQLHAPLVKKEQNFFL